MPICSILIMEKFQGNFGCLFIYLLSILTNEQIYIYTKVGKIHGNALHMNDYLHARLKEVAKSRNG